MAAEHSDAPSRVSLIGKASGVIKMPFPVPDFHPLGVDARAEA